MVDTGCVGSVVDTGCVGPVVDTGCVGPVGVLYVIALSHYTNCYSC